MTNLQTRVTNIDLHPQADQTARDLIANYAEALLLQSKTLAVLQGVDEVQSIHVRSAQDILFSQGPKRGRAKELVTIFGAALFGAFLQGFVTELAAGRALWIAVYVAMGVLGMLLVFLALRK